MTEHVAYPGRYCTDCVEGSPSARITGDKDRENPVEGAPLIDAAAAVIRDYGDERYQQAIADVVAWLENQPEPPFTRRHRNLAARITRRFGKDA